MESTLQSISTGTYKYNSMVIEDDIDSIDIKIINDETGILKGAKESLRKAMQSQSKPFITKSISNKLWVRINSETNEITECKKI